MKKYFFTIYSFMMMELSLKGVVRDVFAVLFCFWTKANRTPVSASFTVLHKITGASRPAIANAITMLVAKGLLSVDKCPGKRSVYEVHLSDSTLQGFEETFGRHSGDIRIGPRDTSSNKSETNRINFIKNNGNKSIYIGSSEEFTSADVI